MSKTDDTPKPALFSRKLGLLMKEDLDIRVSHNERTASTQVEQQAKRIKELEDRIRSLSHLPHY